MTPRAATFTKLDGGAWGVRVTGEKPEEGEVVEVHRRDDSTVKKVIARVVSSSGTTHVCEIANASGAAVAARTDPNPAARTFDPTAEQDNALELFLTGKSLAIEAGAGTGKTSTLVLLAQAVPNRQGQYVAFNRAIVDESAQKFPRNVACNTAHSLAMRAAGKPYQPRIHNSRRFKSHELAAIIGLDPVNVTTWTNEKKTLSPSFLAGVVMRAVDRFCMSADPEPTWKHVPRIDNLDAPPTAERPASYAVNNYVARALEPALCRAWKDLTRYEGALPFKHGHYLKIWQLHDPVIHADFILFDEAQDASPVMVDIVRQQADRGVQVVFVGDSQQEIYSWAGAINALATVPVDQRAFLTQSFRFGPAVADVANRCLEALNAELRLTGTESINSVVGPVADPHAVLCRTNAAAVRYVLGFQRDGKRPFLVGGGNEIASFARAARDLMEGRRTDHPELACFDSWGEVIEYVDQDEQGDELRLMVKLVDEFGVDTILGALNNMSVEAAADVVVSTAHKSKGREWNTVQLAGDFKDEMVGEELRLLYVAVTRAKRELDISAVGYLDDDDDDDDVTPTAKEA